MFSSAAPLLSLQHTATHIGGFRKDNLEIYRLCCYQMPTTQWYTHMDKKWTLPGCVLDDTLEHFLYENAFSWKPKKLTKSIVRIGDVSLVQNSTKHPQYASEVSGENSCEILSLKVWNDPPLALVTFREFFGLMGISIRYFQKIFRYKRIVCCIPLYRVLYPLKIYRGRPFPSK